MRLNPLPLLFAPGVALAGYFVAGTLGALTASLAWLAIVLAATACAFIFRTH